MKIGFVGPGIMGAPVAAHLIKAGHQVFLYSIPSGPQDLVTAGGVACSNGKEAARKVFNRCAAHGGRAWDHSAMVRALERRANSEIGQSA